MIPFWWACCTAWQTGTNSSSRCAGVRWFWSQYSVIGTPLTSSITKYGRPDGGGPAVEHLGDVGVVHQRQGLPLGLEPGDHLPGVHARLDDLQGDLAADRLGLLGHEDDAEAALADLLQQLVRADHRAGALRGGLVDGRHGVAPRRSVQQAVGGVGGRQQGLDVGDPGLVPAARLPDVLPAGGPGRGCPGRRGRSPRCSGRDAVMGASAAGRRARPEHNARNRGRTRNVFFQSVRAGGRTCGRSPPGASSGRTPSPSRRWRARRPARRPPARRSGRRRTGA